MTMRAAPHRKEYRRPGMSRWHLASPRPILPNAVLPRELSAFVGRLEETAALTRYLRDGASLITLTGIGGVGKTRLATYTAGQLQANYASGAHLVTLAQVPEGADVAAAVLAKLGSAATAGRHGCRHAGRRVGRPAPAARAG